MGLVASGDEGVLSEDGLVKEKRSGRRRRRRVSHEEEQCPCRLHGKPVTSVRRPKGGGVVVLPVEPEDKISVMDECARVWPGRNRAKERFASSLERKATRKRFSVTSTSSAVSMLGQNEKEDEEPAGDCNNNSVTRRRRNSEEQEEEGKQNRRNEEREEVRGRGRGSFGSSSSFTKDIMLIIHNTSQRGDLIATKNIDNDDNTDNDKFTPRIDSTRNSITEGGNDAENIDRRRRMKEETCADRSSEVILKMNRRNSDMSEKKILDRAHIICECPCHDKDEDFKKITRKRGSKKKSPPTSPSSKYAKNCVNIYSIEEPGLTKEKWKKKDEGEVGLEKGQLEDRSDNESDRARSVDGEYDNDELEFEDEVERRRRRMRVGGENSVL